ncbi:MAG: hypothetical protein BWX84_00275 [Verrucomicrobia bacterium ADurb.Bin118]|nr:MAG: hypothetical protein BWX84_00275 [Verrucomicrobia bacterium ADurb.Bin118]
MPPLLALLLCTAFVGWMLRFDRRLSPLVSPVAWLPTLWLFSVTTKPLVHWLGASSGDAWSSPWDQRFQISLLVWGLIVLVRRSFDWPAAIRNQPWPFLLLGFMLISCFWADLTFVTFKRWGRQFVAIVMALVVLSENNPRQTVESLLRRFAYILLPFSIVLIKYFPHYGIEFHRWSGGRMWVGVATQKNGLGIVCFIALLFLLWTVFRRWQRRDQSVNRLHAGGEGVILFIGLYMLFLPEGKNSATSIAAFLLGIGTILVLGWLRYRRTQLRRPLLTFSVLALIGVGIGLPLSGKGLGDKLGGAMGRDATLTGRADTWAEMVPQAMKRPVLGCGFESYWTPDTRELHRMSNAHNAYLEIFNELGGLGLLLFALFWLSVAQAAWQASMEDADWGALAISYLLIILLHGVSESSINAFTSQLGSILLLLLVSCTGLVRRAASLASDDQVLPFPSQRPAPAPAFNGGSAT